MYLYEMSNAAKQLYDMLTSEEIDEQTYNDTLESLGTGEKLESYCKIIRQLEADVEALKLEKQRFADKQSTAENSIKRLKAAILNFLSVSGQKKANAGIFTVSKSESPAVNIINESLIPEEFLKPQPPKVDKIAIKNAIKNGSNVAGAEIVINENIRIK